MPPRPSDPLEHRRTARLLVVVIGAVLLASLVFDPRRVDPALPMVALGSPWLLAMERAVLAGALLAAVAVFVLRGWDGYFPSKVSTSGAEYPSRTIADVLARSDAASAMASVETEQRLALLAADLDMLAQRITTIESKRDDML